MGDCNSSNELLALLYQETSNQKSKERIYNIIYKRLEREAFDVCHYYKNLLNKLADKEAFFEDAMQEAGLCLMSCIEKYKTDKDAQLATFYRKCLQNHISDFFKDFKKRGRNEMIDSEVFNWIVVDDSENDIADDLDSQFLRKTMKKHIDNIKFSKPVHENIFREYMGFLSNGEITDLRVSFGDLGEKYNLSRAAIKKVIDKYMAQLTHNLSNNGDMYKLKEYL